MGLLKAIAFFIASLISQLALSSPVTFSFLGGAVVENSRNFSLAPILNFDNSLVGNNFSFLSPTESSLTSVGYKSHSITVDDINTPEPSSYALFGMGLAALGGFRKRKILRNNPCNTINSVTNKPKILIIDGSKTFLGMMINSILQKHGNKFTIRAATTGDEAIKMLDHFKPDMIIVDVFMRDTMDDSLFVRSFTQNKFYGKIVAMFGNYNKVTLAKQHMDHSLQLAQQIGADVSIKKETIVNAIPFVVDEYLDSMVVDLNNTFGTPSHMSPKQKAPNLTPASV